MKITKRGFFYIFLFVIIISLLIFRVIDNLNQKQSKEESPSSQLQTSTVEEGKVVPVRTVKAGRGEINSYLKVNGIVEANENIRVTSSIMGRVKEIKAKEGQEVSQGDILVLLDDEEIKIQVAQAQATLDSAQAYYDKIKSGARPQEIKQAESALLQAEVNRDSAEENYLRMEKLFAEKVISGQEYEAAENQYKIAQAQYQTARESYDLVMEGAAEEDIRAAEAQVRQAKAALDIARHQLNNTKITAPIGGKIASVNISLGELVSISTPLMSIIDTSKLFVTVGISEKDISMVNEGQKVELTIDAFPEEEFIGEVFSKGVAVDQVSKTLEIKIEIIEPKAEIPVGVFARGNILVKNKKDAIIIPLNALVREKGGIYVYVVEDMIARKREVILGITQDEQVEILEGLSEGQEVIIIGNQELKDGEKVNILDEEE